MTSETKKRIAQMNSGIVPKGYKKTKVGIVPVEWEETMFSNLFLILKNNTFSRAELNDEKGECFNIHYGDILTKFNTILDCDKDSLPFINQGMVIKTDYLIDGDIIIADTAEDNTAGKLIEIRNIHEKRIVSGLHTIPCRPKKKIAPKWLGYYMDSFAFHNQLIPIITGIKVSSISKNEIQKTSLVLPTLPEQQKIAEILSTQDKLIELKQKLIDLKKQQKKWLMHELLTGKKRLKGFSGEWRKVKLGDICEVTSVKRVHESDWSDKGIPFYRAREIVALHNNVEIAPLYISKELYDENCRKCGKIKENDLLVTGVGTIGIPYLVKQNDEFYFKDGNIIWIKNLGKINGFFLFYQFDSPFIQNQIKNMAGIGTVCTYTIENAKKTFIIIPPLPEQTAIAEILSQQDNEIELLEKELELQKQKKKALMQLLLTGKVRVKI